MFVPRNETRPNDLNQESVNNVPERLGSRVFCFVTFRNNPFRNGVFYSVAYPYFRPAFPPSDLIDP